MKAMKQLAPLFLAAAIAMGSASSATAAGTIEIKFSEVNGWVTGSVTGPDPWPYDEFTLEGSFAAGSTAVITFGDTGAPTLTVDPLYEAELEGVSFSSFVLAFSASTSPPSVIITPNSGPFVVPMLILPGTPGGVVYATGTSIGLTTRMPMVPEPGSYALMLAGLASFALMWRRRGR